MLFSVYVVSWIGFHGISSYDFFHEFAYAFVSSVHRIIMASMSFQCYVPIVLAHVKRRYLYISAAIVSSGCRFLDTIAHT